MLLFLDEARSPDIRQGELASFLKENGRRFGLEIPGVPLRFRIRGPVRSSTWMNTASHREDIPIIITSKVFFQLVCL
jgi:hypothetical protein